MTAKWMNIFGRLPKVRAETTMKSESTYISNSSKYDVRVVVMHGDGHQNLFTLVSNTTRCIKASSGETLTVAILDSRGDDVEEMRSVRAGTNLIVVNDNPTPKGFHLYVAKSDSIWDVDDGQFSKKEDKQTRKNNSRYYDY